MMNSDPLICFRSKRIQLRTSHSKTLQILNFLHLPETGKERDRESGLDYYPARYRDADVGYWISPDAARQFPNLYGYGTNPLNSVDQDGNETQIVVDKNGIVQNSDITLNMNLDVTVFNMDGENNNNFVVYKNAELRESSYILNQAANDGLKGYKWVGSFQSDLDLFLNKAIDQAPGEDAVNFRTNGSLDFKASHVNQIGIAYGKLMTSRDAGNALFGYYMGASYYPYLLAKISAGLYQCKSRCGRWEHLGEDRESGNMNNWGLHQYKRDH